MSELAPGLRIIVRDEEWMINKIENNSFGNKAVYCTGISPLVKDKESVFLEDLEEVSIVDPAQTKLVADTSPLFKKSKLYIESNLRQKIPTDSKIHVGYKAAMDLMDFQLVPTTMSLSTPRQRILIADSVGLGKTLEAGILMSELIARGKGKRILVVTVKSMMMQFQKEMWNRFSIPLIRLDSSKIQKIRNSLPSNYNPFFYYDKTIISMDTLKRDIEYRTYLENAHWDIIVIDEAHNVADRGISQTESQRSKLAKLLSKNGDALILLSATPHDGKAESFASLMNMLDPTAIANPHDYTKEDIKGLCVRRFKSDINDQLISSFQEREVNIEKSYASNVEERVYDYFADMKLEMDSYNKKATGQLFKTSLEKSLFSSPAACIKSIDERLRKLINKYGDNKFKDINTLKELKSLLEQIKPDSFSRYQQLLQLLNNSEYNWHANTDDRIVIFTERIETMKWLAKYLREDLNMNEDQVKEMYGGMSDVEQQEIVDEFGKKESPIRVLVASDVASEGINLHYLSHRLIHFDIPWSLMVFQQRNGRIDRYGQTKKPDIRYFLIQSKNEKIKGDTRIMEILIKKEEQAYKNIGDPTLLMGKFNVEEEEQEVANVIETNMSSEEFEKQLDNSSKEFDPFEILMRQEDIEKGIKNETANDLTIFSDKDYIETALSEFNTESEHSYTDLGVADGIEIKLTPEMKRRLKTQVPDEAMPDDDELKLSTDKEFIMDEMKRSMQNDLNETAWSQAQYLWRLHPIFSIINDKSKLLFGRGEAPVLGIKSNNTDKSLIYIISGSIFNRKSTPVIDEWFGVKVKNNEIIEVMSIKDLFEKTKLLDKNIPNEDLIKEKELEMAQSNMGLAINKIKEILSDAFREYDDVISTEVLSYMQKLDKLKEKQLEYNQISLFETEGLSRTKQLKKNNIESTFNEYYKWYKDSLEAEDKPFIKIIAVLMEV